MGPACGEAERLGGHARRLAAAAETLERACRMMRTPWAPVMAELLVGAAA